MLMKEAIWRELERFNIIEDHDGKPVALKDLSSLLQIAKQGTGTEPPYAIASVLMRSIAFVFVAQLYALSKYRLKWSGDGREIFIANRTIGGRWAPQWILQNGSWVTVSEEDVFLSLQRMICDECGPIVKALAIETKSSPMVLWENVWGYVLWMYVQLFQESGPIAERAHQDLELLLDHDVWKDIERSSPFKKFLQGKTPEEAMASFARVTCCLYYMVPGNERCSYCPLLSRDKCLQPE
ncbi:(2Fe-2S)-binding protein [Peribacillus sp. SCS-155]|uniref:(2Fe-2S)-binding protein n=1 Tax=Peribacillus sedimenti TaxID=3115297 RepID=UPI003905D951